MNKYKSNKMFRFLLLCLLLLSFFVLLTVSVFAAAGTDQPNNSVKIGNTVYDITSTAGLVDADLALLQWEAKGSVDNSEITGVFSDVLYSGFDAVYAQVYERLLAKATPITSMPTDRKSVV